MEGRGVNGDLYVFTNAKHPLIKNDSNHYKKAYHHSCKEKGTHRNRMDRLLLLGQETEVSQDYASFFEERNSYI